MTEPITKAPAFRATCERCGWRTTEGYDTYGRFLCVPCHDGEPA
jgi:formylmethanofuran dehydrogenase subunit E